MGRSDKEDAKKKPILEYAEWAVVDRAIGKRKNTSDIMWVGDGRRSIEMGYLGRKENIGESEMAYGITILSPRRQVRNIAEELGKSRQDKKKSHFQEQK